MAPNLDWHLKQQQRELDSISNDSDDEIPTWGPDEEFRQPSMFVIGLLLLTFVGVFYSIMLWEIKLWLDAGL